MKKLIRVFFVVFLTVGCLIAAALTAEAGLYRYVGENGVMHFTDDIQKVPENQRPAVIPEEQEPDEKLTDIQAPLAPDDKIASMGDDDVALFAEKEALDTEFLEIIGERDRLERERSIPGGPAEVKEYNDAVFRLKDRITSYQKRCDEYETRVKELNEKMGTLEKKFANPMKAEGNPAPGKSLR